MSQPMHTGSIKTSDCFTANLCGKESKMNHLGDTNKMVDTPRTDENTFRAYTSPDNSSRSCVSASFARQLERELNAAQQRIKRLEEAGDRMRLFCADPDDCFAWDKAKEAKL